MSEWRFLRAGLVAVGVLIVAALVGWAVDTARYEDPGFRELKRCLVEEKGAPVAETRDPIARSAELGALDTVIETNPVTVAVAGDEKAGRAARVELPSRWRRPRPAARAARPYRLSLAAPTLADTASGALRLHVLSAKYPSPSVTAVLFTCAGQRVDIVSAFGRTGATTIATDADALAPALYHADHHALVVRVDSPGYIPALAALVAEHDVKLIVPLTDLDQMLLAQSRDALAPALVLVPEPEVCRTMGDKYEAHLFFERHGIASPRSWLPEDVPDDARYPLLVKVREGFGSRHIYRAHDRRSSTSSSATRPSTRSCRSSARARSSRSTSSATSRAPA